jgi:hypothetical protein
MQWRDNLFRGAHSPSCDRACVCHPVNQKQDSIGLRHATRERNRTGKRSNCCKQAIALIGGRAAPGVNKRNRDSATTDLRLFPLLPVTAGGARRVVFSDGRPDGLHPIQGPNGQPGYVWLTSDRSNGRIPVHEIRIAFRGSLRGYCWIALGASSRWPVSRGTQTRRLCFLFRPQQ